MTIARKRKKMMKLSNVQIPEELFIDIARYFTAIQQGYEPNKEFTESITDKILDKLESITNRQLYTAYRTAKTEEEREQARINYLKSKGLPDFKQKGDWTIMDRYPKTITSSRGKAYTSSKEANKDDWIYEEKVGNMNILDSKLEQEKQYRDELYNIYCQLEYIGQ